MKILVTGANGFIAKNLIVHLKERKYDVLCFTKQDEVNTLSSLIAQADFIFHLAGVNRPETVLEYEQNFDLTKELCLHIRRLNKCVPVVFSSSTQAEFDSAYGLSKRKAENELLNLHEQMNMPLYIFRLPNVFGKWCRPNYNSAIATFCYNTVNNFALSIHDPDAKLNCVYIDDVINQFLWCLSERKIKDNYLHVNPVYQSTVGEVASIIQSFPALRSSLFTDRVGAGLVRALYSTYLTYLPTNSFSYNLPIHADNRGVFVEMLKTPDCGQFSYFTAKPGITRGGHYHHTKAEKFLVIRGEAEFNFKHILTGETFQVSTCGSEPQVVETVPGWSHNIVNVGQDELIALLWANEAFNVNLPDTIGHEV